jgi:hypothetical protein
VSCGIINHRNSCHSHNSLLYLGNSKHTSGVLFHANGVYWEYIIILGRMSSGRTDSSYGNQPTPHCLPVPPYFIYVAICAGRGQPEGAGGCAAGGWKHLEFPAGRDQRVTATKVGTIKARPLKYDNDFVVSRCAWSFKWSGGSGGGFYKRFRSPAAPLPAGLYRHRINAITRQGCIRLL